MYKDSMTHELKPRRVGVTRKMKGLPETKEQEASLVSADCYPIFTWAEFPQAIPSFIEGDVVVAFNSAVFGSNKYPFTTEALNDGIPKAKTGPVPTLDKCNADQMDAIEFIVGDSGYPMAVRYCRARLGITTDRHALYHRLKRKKRNTQEESSE